MCCKLMVHNFWVHFFLGTKFKIFFRIRRFWIFKKNRNLWIRNLWNRLHQSMYLLMLLIILGSGYSRKTKIFVSGIYEMDSIRVCTYLLILLIMCIVHELIYLDSVVKFWKHRRIGLWLAILSSFKNSLFGSLCWRNVSVIGNITKIYSLDLPKKAHGYTIRNYLPNV